MITFLEVLLVIFFDDALLIMQKITAFIEVFAHFDSIHNQIFGFMDVQVLGFYGS